MAKRLKGIKVCYNHWLFRWLPYVSGAVLYPYILFRDGKDQISDELFRHELEHIYQMQVYGPLWYYIKYLWFHLDRGYLLNPYEIAAYSAQRTPMTAVERSFQAAS